MILDEIKAETLRRIEREKASVSENELKEKAFSLKEKSHFKFRKAIEKDGLSFICEVKKASPSKGIITESFNWLEIAFEYEKAGADCISVLTEPKWFKGSDKYLEQISEKASIPTLRKDFTCDSYMIYQAKCFGADAVLLIAAILSEKQLYDYMRICSDLGLTALVEAHDKDEIIKSLSCGAELVGVNNRNLKDFTVDASNCLRLRELVGDKALFVAESGIKTAEDIELLSKNGVDGVLIGETMMLAENKKEMLSRLKGKLK